MTKLWRELIFITDKNNKKTEILILLSNDMYLWWKKRQINCQRMNKTFCLYWNGIYNSDFLFLFFFNKEIFPSRTLTFYF